MGILKYDAEETQLSILFFSEQNIKNISNRIRLIVFQKTGKKIADLNRISLLEKMREVYLNFKKWNPDWGYDGNLKETKRLSNIVIDSLSVNLISRVLEYFDNLVDLDNPNSVNLIPQNVSNKKEIPLRSQAEILFGDEWDKANGN